MSFIIFLTLIIIAILIIMLYWGRFKPSIVFLIVAIVFTITGIISIEDLLAGMANKQIIVIFLLILLTSGIQRNIGNGFLNTLFGSSTKVGAFRLRFMGIVAALSSLINNTPIVAFLIPFIKGWAEKHNIPASRLLIPLSYATILGGMITVVGTSTNLVLNGLIAQSGLQLLGFFDFFYLGLLVSVTGLIYLGLFSDYFLPYHKEQRQQVLQHLNEYIVETVVEPHSLLCGKTVQDAGLRNLQKIFLVEIKRENRTIVPVSPEEVILSGDLLFFAGNTSAIFELIQEKNGLSLSEENHVLQNGFFKMAEAIVPSGSMLEGQTLKDSNFRNKYKGSVISVYRKGERVSGNLGDIRFKAGDMLLMLIGTHLYTNKLSRDLVVITQMGDVIEKQNRWGTWPSIMALLVLIAGIVGFIDLFFAVVFGILMLQLFGLYSVAQIRESIDFDLLVILVSSLAVGLAITQSGTADFLVTSLLQSFQDASNFTLIIILFVLTVLLTSLITNAAAVSIVFPFAISLGEKTGGDYTPFFVVIAFAASASFITPIGYQTNLMVMGPGNYRFKDYVKIGTPLTIIYSLVCLMYIKFFYQL